MPDLEAVPVASPPRAVWRHAGLTALDFHNMLLHLLRSERPQAAAATWSALLLHADADGTVLVQRGDLARTAMVALDDASRALTDLVRLGAITRQGGGRGSRYHLNREPISPPPPLGYRRLRTDCG